MSASRTGALKVVTVLVTGSRIGSESVAYSAEPNSLPLALTVGLRRSDEIRSWRDCFSFPQSQVVTTTLRSTPCGRGGLLWGSSPLATRPVQSPTYLCVAPPRAP